MSLTSLFAISKRSKEGHTDHILKKVVLIDDDPLVGLVLNAIFEDLSMEKKIGDKWVKFDFKHFQAVDDALTDVSQKVDLILLDYHLDDPLGRTGSEIRRQLLDANPAQKIAMISSQQEGQLVFDLIKEGVRNYISKGEDLEEELRQTIEELIFEME